MKRKIFFISAVFFLIDLITKFFVKSFDNYPLSIIDGFFDIDMVMNDGAAFSSFRGYQFVLVVIAIFVLLYIVKSIVPDVKTRLSLVSVSLLIGGIVGNLFDRIFYGKVIDFLSFNIFGYMFPVFNFADVFICCGIVLYLIDYLRGEKYGISSK